MIPKSEREELCKVVRMRAKVAKADIGEREAVLLADVEQQLSARYKADDSAWAEITRRADDVVRQADEEIAALCRERGIPEEFRPELRLAWYSRGENAERSRRDELRRKARANIEVAVRRAKTEVERQTVAVLTRLASDALVTSEARAFLDTIPTAEALLPMLDVAALQPAPKLASR